jgi:hypothetical protein
MAAATSSEIPLVGIRTTLSRDARARLRSFEGSSVVQRLLESGQLVQRQVEEAARRTNNETIRPERTDDGTEYLRVGERIMHYKDRTKKHKKKGT